MGNESRPASGRTVKQFMDAVRGIPGHHVQAAMTHLTPGISWNKCPKVYMAESWASGARVFGKRVVGVDLCDLAAKARARMAGDREWFKATAGDMSTQRMPKSPTPLMQAALAKIGEDWTPYPNDVYERTLQAMRARGLIEERYQKNETGGGRWGIPSRRHRRGRRSEGMKVYYAHSIGLYGTEQEQRDIATLQRLGFIVCNPNAPEHGAGYKRDGMVWFQHVIDGCRALAFRANPDGSINAGVDFEIRYARARDLPIIELPSSTTRRALTPEQTREYLREVGHR